MVGIVTSFGAYTPIYPFLRDYVPPFGMFRFPVKYFVVTAMAVAAGAAAGWDGLVSGRTTAGHDGTRDPLDARRSTRARLLSIGFPATIGCSVLLFAAACAYLPRRSRIRSRCSRARWEMRREPAQPSGCYLLSARMSAGRARLTRRCRAVRPAHRTARTFRLAGWTFVIGHACRRGSPGSRVGYQPCLGRRALRGTRVDFHIKAYPDARFYVGGKRERIFSPVWTLTGRAATWTPRACQVRQVGRR